MHRKSLTILKMIVDDFNRRFPVGTPVRVLIFPGHRDTFIRRAAEIIGDHSAAVWFEGIEHYMSIEGPETVFKRE
jgi:hypothetical protein